MPTIPIALVGGSACDEDLVRSAFAESSGSDEFEVRVFRTASQMMSALADGEIHCILLGADASALDDVLSAVAELDPDMPVVALREEMDGPILLRTVTYALQSARVRIGLRGLSEHLRSVLDSLTEGVIVRSADGRILTVNAKAEHMAGESMAGVRDDAYDFDADHIFNEDGTPCGMDELPSSVALRTGQPAPAKVICIERRDGSRLWLECSATLLHSEADGSVSGVVTSLRDLTDRRSAEESLRFRSHLLDAVGQIVIANDAKGVVLYWNAAAEATFGWSSVDALGRYVTDVTSLDVSRANEILDAVASGQPWTGEVFVRRRDGSEFRALASDTPVFNDAGQLIAIIGVLTDVTTLYEIDESLRLQSALLSAVGQCVVATDIDDRVIYWNAAATREFGWTEAEMLGRDASATLAHDSRLELARDLEENLRRGEYWSGDLLMKRKDGSIFTAAVSTSPVLDDDGQVVRF
ncbi:MAG: PAS domain S-box protein, partial [bacterium]|nr:PAS domain S-box protein [bacterium]